MERVRTKRTARRAQNTRIVREATAILNTADVSQIEAIARKLEVNYEELKKLNTELEPFIADGDLENEYQSVIEYEEETTHTLSMLQSRAVQLHSGETTRPSTSAIASRSEERRRSGVKLPKLQLQSFKGELAEWQPFWQQFKRAIHENEELSSGEKFQYLKTLLSGPARASIAGLQVTDACYNDAIEIITRQFGDHRRIQQDHLTKLRTLPSVTYSNDTKGLRRLYDQVQTHIRGLQGLGVSADSYSTMLMDIVIKALPSEIVVDFYRRAGHSERKTVRPYEGDGDAHSSPPTLPAEELGSTSSTSRTAGLSARLPPRAEDVQLRIRRAEGDLQQLLEYLLIEIESRERSGISDDRPPRKNREQLHQRAHLPTSAVLHTKAQDNKKECIFCKTTGHSTENCTSGISLMEKKKKLSGELRCFRCTLRGHRSKDCHRKLSCTSCAGRHATSMCDPTWKPSVNTSAKQTITTSVQSAGTRSTGISLDDDVLLQTFRTWVVEDGNAVYARAIFDGGSQRTFVREDVSRKLGLKVLGETRLRLNTFGSSTSLPHPRRLVEVKLRSQYNNEECIIEAVEIPFICEDIVQVPVNHEFVRSIEEDGGSIADKLLFPGVPTEPGISLLIGSDQIWKVASERVRRCESNCSLMALDTKFGWTFQGPVTLQCSLTGRANTMVCVLKIGTIEAEDDATLRSFWDLESIGITDKTCSSGEAQNEVWNDFKRTIAKVNGRYEVCLPWKPNAGELNDNRATAMKRLEGLQKRLSRNESLSKEYSNAMLSYLNDGHAEKVPSELPCTNSRTYYMPHQAVLRMNSETTKLRVVFDASSHANEAASLNDHLEKGPNMNADLVEVLIRFRTYPIALTADIEKAFLQVSVRPDDRDALRFLWFDTKSETSNKEPPLEEWRMTRVPFGTSASPFLLSATLKHHLQSVTGDMKKTARIIQKSFYVDDLLLGTQTVEEAADLHKQANEILKAAGMTLRKWATNARHLQDMLDDGHKTSTFSEPRGILGLRWRRDNDTLMIPVENVLNFISGNRTTKRCVLRAAARVFDPLGLISPFVIRVKVLFQRLWERGLNWDEELPEDLSGDWQQWCKELSQIEDIATNRYVMSRQGENKTSLQLHVFCDASPLAYGTCAYLRVKEMNGKTDVSLVFSKTRVAPIKRLTLPRLELMAAVIGNRIGKYLKEMLDLQEIFFWTDSTIALHWIKGSAVKWKPFVSNRVTEIQSGGDPASWNHCPGLDNPADLMTRGISVDKLQTSQLWWNGPRWLSEDRDTWPGVLANENIPTEVAEEERKSKHKVLQILTNVTTPLLKLERYSRLGRLLRVTAWIMRFVNNCKTLQKRAEGPLITEEMERAERHWVRRTQEEAYPNELNDLLEGGRLTEKSSIIALNPYLDAHRLMRVGGRLQNMNEAVEIKHPLLLPPEHPFTELLINDMHRRTLHGGLQDTVTQLRELYWVPRARQTVKRAVNRCNACARSRVKRASAPTAPLPKDRVNESSPFEVVGVDFAGPLLVRSRHSEKKSYIALFTCAVTRAVHLELVTSLATPTFLMAFQRFTSRRGTPRVVYSDNALTFKRASKDVRGLWNVLKDRRVQEHYTEQRIQWKFIVDRAAW